MTQPLTTRTDERNGYGAIMNGLSLMTLLLLLVFHSWHASHVTKSLTSNQSPEATAVGAGRAAGRVDPASSDDSVMTLGAQAHYEHYDTKTV
jgi:hypothetical protein